MHIQQFQTNIMIYLESCFFPLGLVYVNSVFTLHLAFPVRDVCIMYSTCETLIDWVARN